MGQNENTNYRQVGLLWIVILAGVALTFFATRESVRLSELQAATDFSRGAEQYAVRVRSELKAGLTAADDIYSYYMGGDGVSRDTFIRLINANSNLNANRQFVGLVYALTENNTADFFTSIDGTYNGKYNVREPKNADFEPGSKRRFPLLFIRARDEGFRSRLEGLNIGGLQVLNGFLETVLAHQSPSVIFLPAFPELDDGVGGQVLMANPFMSKSGQTGLIVQLVDFQGIIDAVSDELTFPKNKLQLDAQTSWADDQPTIGFGGADEKPFTSHIAPYTQSFSFGAAQWQLRVRPFPGTFPIDYSTAAITASVCVLLTSLFFFIVWSQLRRARRVADIVSRRTRALKEAHDELEEHYKLLQNLNKDVEESRRSAELANRAKSEFLATMSHELRTPLNAILGFSQLLGEQALGPIGDKRYVEYSKDIHSSGSHLLSLINDILDLAKLEAGKINIEKNAVSTRLLTERVITLLTQQAATKNIELCAEFDDNMPDNILGDELRLRQILINLCSNAIKFTQEGSVTARMFAKPFKNGRVGWVLEVQDTGIGIPDDKQATLFDRFTQVDAALSRRHGGVGLGLAICRELIDRMEGTISVRSTVNVGTAIRVHLPLEEASSKDLDNEMMI